MIYFIIELQKAGFFGDTREKDGCYSLIFMRKIQYIFFHW